ncbi:hypothetical protein BH23GEM9_BH23GEM9_22410 [soil metagenome]
MRWNVVAAATLVLVWTTPAWSQDHAHGGSGHQHGGAVSSGAQPAEMGQAVFSAVAEVVSLLLVDPNTDWSRVDLERLRQHLIDMNEVALNARVVQTAVPDGLYIEVEGDGRTRDAIRRMALAHAAQGDLLPGARIAAAETATGASLRVTAVRAGDIQMEAKIRGLGFIGLMTLGSHHGPHHLAMARGDSAHGH